MHLRGIVRHTVGGSITSRDNSVMTGMNSGVPSLG